MGLTAHPDGIQVRFLDAQDQLESPAIFGAKVALRGAPRSAITATAVMTPEEAAEPGSDDWLTLVAVADTDARLDGLVAGFGGPGATSIPNTSAASHRVRIEVETAQGKVTKTGRITVAEGDILSEDPPKMQVRVLNVLAEGSVMSPGHPRHEEFQKVIIFSVP